MTSLTRKLHREDWNGAMTIYNTFLSQTTNKKQVNWHLTFKKKKNRQKNL